MASKNKPVTGFKEVFTVSDNDYYHIVHNNVDKKVKHSTLRDLLEGAGVDDSITDGVVDRAPSQNAVFDALAGKFGGTVSINYYPVSDGSHGFSNGRISQTSTNLTIKSADTNTNVYVNNSLFLATSLAGSSQGSINVQPTSMQMAWTDGTVTSQLSMQDVGTAVRHSALLVLDSPLIYLEKLSANRVLITDSGKYMRSSSVTDTELSYLGGATSNIQTQINALAGGGSGDLKKDGTVALTAFWDAKKSIKSGGVTIGGEEFAINIDGAGSPNGLKGVFDGDGIDIGSISRAIHGYGVGAGTGIHAESEDGYALIIGGSGKIKYDVDIEDRQMFVTDAETRELIPIPYIDYAKPVEEIQDKLDEYLPTVVRSLPRFSIGTTGPTANTDYDLAASIIRGGSFVNFHDVTEIKVVFIPAAATAASLTFGFKINGVTVSTKVISLLTTNAAIVLTVFISRVNDTKLTQTFVWNFGGHSGPNPPVEFYEDTAEYDFSQDINITAFANKLSTGRAAQVIQAHGFLITGEKID